MRGQGRSLWLLSLLGLPQLFLHFLYIFLVLNPPATASQELLLSTFKLKLLSSVLWVNSE